MQRFASLPLALKVLVSVVVLGVLLVLVTGVPAIVARTSERFSGFLGGVAGPQQPATQEQAPAREEEYLGMVEDVQAGSVESFLASDDKFRRFDSLTQIDVEEMESDRNALEGYLDRTDDLDPPEEYEDQYEVFRSAVSNLYRAAGLAYSMAADPGSVTRSSLNDYDLLVERAGSQLQQSNEILGRDFGTISSQRSG